MSDKPDFAPARLANQATILVVDGAPENVALLQGLLQVHYTVQVAHNGQLALESASSSSPPDLILLDTQVPGIDGYEVCRLLQADPQTRPIPIVLMAVGAAHQEHQMGLALGAADYIAKPVSPSLVLSRVRTHLALKASAVHQSTSNEDLEGEVHKRTREVMAIQDVTIVAIASLAETRDSDTGNHIRRTQHYVRALAWKLSTHPRFSQFLTPSNIATLFKSAPLHDIGKVGIPDRILLKPGKLTGEEFDIMKTHTTLGRDAIAHAERELGMDVAFLVIAKEIAYSHQEKWDGSGYPQGLAAEQIPISARLMAVADVYDALISRRVYKQPVSHVDAVRIIQMASGTHFDPDVVKAFLDIADHFHAIALSYADSEEDIQKKLNYLGIAQVPKPTP